MTLRLHTLRLQSSIIFGGMQALSWLIFLFGVVNLINTTFSNQVSRKRENSILRSVGLTGKQLCRMNIIEGMCYAFFATLSLFWAAGILAVIIFVRQAMAVLAVTLGCFAAAALYLYFADAYDFYSAAAAKKSVWHTGRTGSVFTYLLRYLMANKNYFINTVGLCAIACFLPLMSGTEIVGFADQPSLFIL